MNKSFPRTEVAGISLPRMLIGTNWLAGYSHTTPSADNMIKNTHNGTASIGAVLEAFLEYDIDAVLGSFSKSPYILPAVKETIERTGRNIIIIDTPNLNVDDNEAARREAEIQVKRSKDLGATFCLPHHCCIEQLVNRNTKTIDRLDDYTQMIRDAGMIPGLSAHMPEIVVYTDEREYDVEAYIQIFNCMGFMMQVEIESVAKIINKAKKPVMTIKSMAAGRCTPYVGLNFSWATIRERDMITVGCFSPQEVHEDIEISFAAFEHRFPNLGKRNSPQMNQAAFG